MKEITKLLFKNVRYFELEPKFFEIKCINIKKIKLKCKMYTVKFKAICHLMLKNVTILSVHEPNPNINKTKQWNVT